MYWCTIQPKWHNAWSFALQRYTAASHSWCTSLFPQGVWAVDLFRVAVLDYNIHVVFIRSEQFGAVPRAAREPEVPWQVGSAVDTGFMLAFSSFIAAFFTSRTSPREKSTVTCWASWCSSQRLTDCWSLCVTCSGSRRPIGVGVSWLHLHTSVNSLKLHDCDLTAHTVSAVYMYTFGQRQQPGNGMWSEVSSSSRFVTVFGSSGTLMS